MWSVFPTGQFKAPKWSVICWGLPPNLFEESVPNLKHLNFWSPDLQAIFRLRACDVHGAPSNHHQSISQIGPQLGRRVDRRVHMICVGYNVLIISKRGRGRK